MCIGPRSTALPIVSTHSVQLIRYSNIKTRNIGITEIGKERAVIYNAEDARSHFDYLIPWISTIGISMAIADVFEKGKFIPFQGMIGAGVLKISRLYGLGRVHQRSPSTLNLSREVVISISFSLLHLRMTNNFQLYWTE